MTQLVYKQNFKKRYSFSVVHHLNCSQSALHIADDSSMKDVLQLTSAIVMASSARKKLI